MVSFFIPLPSTRYTSNENSSNTAVIVLCALIPSMLLSIIFFGMSSFRITAIAIVSCLFFEYLFQKYILKETISIRNGSIALSGVLFAFTLPVGIPFWLVIMGASILVLTSHLSFGKTFGNPFNAALIARIALWILFREPMTTWTSNITDADTFSGATPLALIQEGVKNGRTTSQIIKDIQMPEYFDMFWGNMSGSLGEISTVALLLGGFYLLWKKVITWHIPVSILGSFFVLQSILWILAPGRYIDPVFHLITGGIMLGAIFMATDLVSSEIQPAAKVYYGLAIGIITFLIRNFSSFPEGISIAIVLMNCFLPLLTSKVKSYPDLFALVNFRKANNPTDLL